MTTHEDFMKVFWYCDTYAREELIQILGKIHEDLGFGPVKNCTRCDASSIAFLTDKD